MPKIKLLRILFALTVLVIVFSFSSKASAAESFINITSGLTFSNPSVGNVCGWYPGVYNSPIIYGFYVYRNSYPNTDNWIAYGGTSSINSMVSSCPGFQLERGFLNGAAITPDGSYWVKMTSTGSPYLPDWANSISYYFEANRSAGIWSLGSAPCTTDCFSNVLFLPGLMGSRLYEAGINCGEVVTGSECGEKELWVSTNDALQEKLALNVQGKSINNLYTKNDTQRLNGEIDEKGIIDDVYNFNIYESFVNDLRKWKDVDKIIADYAFIPYDWRLSLDDVITNGVSANSNLSYTNSQNFSESFILKKLEALQKNSKSGKVTIIAHSNGGLVAKALIQKLKDTNNPLYDKIDKVILIAVPQVGTPDALKSLLHGDKIGWGPIGMSAERERNLAQNMPVAYNLLPSKEYFNSINTTVPLIGFDSSSYYANSVTQYGYAIDNYIELQNYLKNSEVRQTPSYSDLNHANTLNGGLIQNSEMTHDLLDTWVPSSNTKIIEVAGWGEYTLGGIGHRTEQECTDYGFVFEGLKLIYTCLAYKDKQALSTTDILGGDGTVIDRSAHYLSDKNISNTEKWWVDLAGYNDKESIFLNINHKSILEIPGLLDLIKYKIKDSTENSSFPYVSQVKPSSNKPYVRIQLNSPLTLDLYDSLGNHTGLTASGEIEENIPGSRYKTIGESKYILVPKDISTNLELKGYQEGSFSLSIDSLLGDEKISSTTFSAIPSSTTTLVTMDLPANTEVSASTPLVIDFNGDGTIDKELIPKPNEEVIYDTTPPELQVTFDINTKDVIFSAQDTIDKNPTIITTKTSTTLTDNQGNTTIIPFTKYKEKPTKLKFSYNKIIRNGVVATVPDTNIVYDWKEKKGTLTDLDTKITVKGIEKYVFNYNKANNITTIKEKIGKNIKIIKREGFVAVTLKTNENYLNVSY